MFTCCDILYVRGDFGVVRLKLLYIKHFVKSEIYEIFCPLAVAPEHQHLRPNQMHPHLFSYVLKIYSSI